MKILITICARGNSKGVPEKNIRKIAEMTTEIGPAYAPNF